MYLCHHLGRLKNRNGPHQERFQLERKLCPGSKARIGSQRGHWASTAQALKAEWFDLPVRDLRTGALRDIWLNQTTFGFSASATPQCCPVPGETQVTPGCLQLLPTPQKCIRLFVLSRCDLAATHMTGRYQPKSEFTAVALTVGRELAHWVRLMALFFLICIMNNFTFHTLSATKPRVSRGRSTASPLRPPAPATHFFIKDSGLNMAW